MFSNEKVVYSITDIGESTKKERDDKTKRDRLWENEEK